MTGPTSPYPYDGLTNLSPKLASYSVVRRQVSQGAYGNLGIQIIGPKDGAPVDASRVEMHLFHDADFDETVVDESDDGPLGEEIATFFETADGIRRETEGTYAVDITPTHTARRGNLAAVWKYTVGTNEVTYTDRLAIIAPMPTYDALRDFEKDAVEQVNWMFADLFDSTEGGPHLVEEFQTKFGNERLAQLLHAALRRINTHAVPLTRFALGEGGHRIPVHLEGFLTTGLYLETIMHFMRSYVEQPSTPGMNVTYTDRRDYTQRWKVIYDQEKQEYDANLRMAKRSLLGLGRGSLLVSGGIYGTSYFRNGFSAMQARGARFYPAAPAILNAR